jgi:tripartite-type tricarboxylate transporter receptor subunit TctC
VKQPDVARRFGQLGIDPVGSTPEAYNAANRASFEKYAKVVRAAGVKIE